MRFKKWIPGIMLGAMMAVMTSVPVMADNINSGSTPPDRIFDLYDKCLLSFIVKKLLRSKIGSTHGCNRLYLSSVNCPDQHYSCAFTVEKCFRNIVAIYITENVAEVIITMHCFHGNILSAVIIFPAGTAS